MLSILKWRSQAGIPALPDTNEFDGQPNPSDAVYNAITVAKRQHLAVGNTITNLATTSSGYIIAIDGHYGNLYQGC
jgi:hypothetical protein